MKNLYTLAVMILVVAVTSAATTITSAGTGNWSSTTNNAPWPGGIVPTSSDDVVISSGHTVTIDNGSAVCNNVSVSGNLQFANNGAVGTIVISGDLIVTSTGKFRCINLSPTGSYVAHSFTVNGSITNNSGGVIDLRVGSNGTTGNGANLTFAGSSNSTITLVSTTYLNSTEEFNAIYINKSGGAKVVLAAGNLFMSNNGSVDTSKLVFMNGIVETGNNMWVNLGTAGRSVQGASSTSYMNGIMGRGLTNTASASSDRDFYIGDGSTYRPITVRFVAPAGANTTGHFGWAKLVTADANTGSSTLSGGLNIVSPYRYYQVGYEKGATGQTTMSYSFLQPTYNVDDGIVSGSTDVRVAYSTNNRSTWTNAGPASHTTSLVTPPTAIRSDVIDPNITLNTGENFFVALGSTDGTSLPVELSSFTAAVRNGRTELQWITSGEVNNAGFEVEKRQNNEWSSIGFVEGNGTSNVEHRYSFVDANVKGNVSYRLKQIDRDGKFTYSSIVDAAAPLTASDFTLSQNYPNPFNPSTQISFAVKNTEQVSITVYNALGQTVETLFNGVANAEQLYSLNFNGKDLSSGVYYYTLRSASRNEIRKMLLMK